MIRQSALEFTIVPLCVRLIIKMRLIVPIPIENSALSKSDIQFKNSDHSLNNIADGVPCIYSIDLMVLAQLTLLI